MKIVNNDDTFIIPIEKRNVSIIETNGYKDKIIKCLTNYFTLHKKSNCIVYDDNGIMKMDDLNFVHLSSYDIESNLLFQPKSILKNEICNIIENNTLEFTSIEDIRSNLNQLVENKGMNMIINILSSGLYNRVCINVEEFNVKNIISMFSLNYPNNTIEISLIIICNLLIFLSRKKPVLIYIDYPITEVTEKWMLEQKDNVYFLIDNDICGTSNGKDLIVISNKDHFITANESPENIDLISYMLHPVVKNNIRFQIKKNVDFVKEYYDKNSTFFIKNLVQIN